MAAAANKPKEKVILMKDVFKLYGVKEHKDAEKIFVSAFNTLAYLKVGDSVKTSQLKFTKLAEDLIQVSHSLDIEQITETLEDRRIIRFPV